MYTIGLIDDVESEVDNIRSTIFVTWKKVRELPNEVEFKLYKLAPVPEFKEKLQKELLHDVENNVIQSLIVDYKLDSLREVIAGKEIVEFMHDEVPAFPVIILTNVPQSSKKEDVIDPDKVYAKEDFFLLDSAQSKEMAFKIYRNIERYIGRRKRLEASLAEMLEKLHEVQGQQKDVHSSTADAEVMLLTQIAETEDELGDYTPMGPTTAEKNFDLSELHSVIEGLLALEEKLE